MKIKRVAAIVLAATMVLSCSMTAFAYVKVNGVEKSPDETGVVTVETANDVIANGRDEPANVKVTNNVLMTHTTDGTSSPVTAFSNANIEVGSGNPGDGVTQAAVEDHLGAAITAGQGAPVVKVNGDVQVTADSGTAISADTQATVKVTGNVTNTSNLNTSHIIDVGGSAKVIIGGDVKGKRDVNLSGGTVLVEGTIEGSIENNGGMVYVGKLNGDIDGSGGTVYYLIGMADNAAGLKEFKYSGVEGAPSGVNGKNYNSVNANGIAGSQITITSKDGKKKIDISKLVLPTGVSSEVKDGALILKFDDKFKGGIQDMLITLNDIINPTPKKSKSNSSAAVFTGTWNNAVSNGSWTQDAAGFWHFASTQTFRSTWGYIVNPYAGGQPSWFYFDANGNMLTGWQFIQGKWYYLNPSKDGTLGACQLGGITPDGWTVDESGAWVESVPRK